MERDYSASELVALLNQQDECDWIEAKGSGKATYYVPGKLLSTPASNLSTPAQNINNDREGELSTPVRGSNLPTSALKDNRLKKNENQSDNAQFFELPTNLESLPTNFRLLSTKLKDISPTEQKAIEQLDRQIQQLPKRINDRKKLESIICSLCELTFFKVSELAHVLNKNEKYLYHNYIKNLLKKGRLVYKYPEMINHPNQAYKTENRKQGK